MMVEESAQDEKKIKYPKSVFFIVSNEFCERFSYYGMRTVLSLYLREKLSYSEDTSVAIYHTFAMFVYFFPLFGAVLADSMLGKFKTILYLSIVYALGQLILSVSAIPTLGLPIREFSIIGLLLIAFGTGGIKPCVSAFGGDQFILPAQAAYLATFFSLFYFAINSGSLLSTFITPVLRKDIVCFGETSCYSLAFFVPCALMIVSIVVFILGKPLYITKKPQGNVVLDVIKCVSHAICQKTKSSKNNREHWLDYADDEYDAKMINDIKSAFQILKLFIPLPFFWALYDQQGSRWTFQAANMDGDMGFYVIKPDQMQVLNPILIVLMIPVFEMCIYPLLRKINLNTPLRKLTVGASLACVSFIITAIVEFHLEKTYPVLPTNGLGQVRIFNTLNCPVNVKLENEEFILKSLGMWEKTDFEVFDTRVLNYTASYTDCNNTKIINYKFSGSLDIMEATAKSWAILDTSLSHSYIDDVSRAQSGEPYVRGLVKIDDFCIQNPNCSVDITLRNIKTKETVSTIFINKTSLSVSNRVIVESGYYDVYLNDKLVKSNFPFKLGGVYTIVGYLSETKSETKADVMTITQPNSLHMLWLLPQYIVITLGEVMFSVTGLEFAFTQAPESMKSLLQAAWLLTVAFGNLIVVIVAEGGFFQRRMYEFILFAGLMAIDVLIFSAMARLYKYVKVESEEEINIIPLNDVGTISPSLVHSEKRLD